MPGLQSAITNSGTYSRNVNSDVRRSTGCRAFPHALSASLSLSLQKYFIFSRQPSDLSHHQGISALGFSISALDFGPEPSILD
jgi:hypothetical protein